MKKLHLLAASALCSVMFAGLAAAEDFPSRPITLIEPWPAGSSGDITARIFAEIASQKIGQPIVVQNIAGGGGSKAMLTTKSAEPDGYTITNSWVATQIMVPTFQPNIGFEPTDFASIGLMWVNPFLVTVAADHPAQTLEEFVDWAKAQDRTLRVGVCSVVSLPHVVMRRFLEVAEIDNYQSIPSESCETTNVTGLFDGTLDFTTGSLGALQTYGDEIRALAVMTDERSPIDPSIPTAKEQGVDLAWGQATAGWSGMVAPLGVPEERLAYLREMFEETVHSDEFQARMKDGGFTVSYLDPAAFENLWQVSIDSLAPALAKLKN